MTCLLHNRTHGTRDPLLETLFVVFYDWNIYRSLLTVTSSTNSNKKRTASADNQESFVARKPEALGVLTRSQILSVSPSLSQSPIRGALVYSSSPSNWPVPCRLTIRLLSISFVVLIVMPGGIVCGL